MAAVNTPVVMLTSFSTMEKQDPRELPAAREVLGNDSVVELIHHIPVGSLVIPRYRSIPFGDLLAQEVELAGSKLVNSWHEHRWIANSSNWVSILSADFRGLPLTPKTFSLHDIPSLPEGEWFVKGETNSLKNRWFEATYAPTTKDLLRVVTNFMADSYVGHQELVIKPFQKYRKIAEGATGQPIFHERRMFVLDGEILSEGFYWSSFREEVGEVQARVPEEYTAVVEETLKRINGYARFVVVDFAEYENGTWGVVELNDGCMSGLSENDPHELWTNFLKVVAQKEKRDS